MAPDDPDDEYSVFGEGETVEEPGQESREIPDAEKPERKYQHEEWLYQQYAILGKTLQEIADECSVREKTIWRWVQEHGIDTRGGGPRPGPWKDENWLRGQYSDQQKSIYQIADEQDCDEKTIRNWLAEHEIETRDPGESHPASREEKPYRNEDWLREQYAAQEKSAAEIAAGCGVGETTIYRWLDEYGIETRSVEEARQLQEAQDVRLPDSESVESKGESKKIVERSVGSRQYEGPEAGIDVSYSSNLADRDVETVESPYRDEEWLREHYEKAGTASEIAELCNVDAWTIYYWMDKFGIERSRGNTEAKYRDEGWLREAYDDLGTLQAVAEKCSVTPRTIRNWLIRFDIERQPDAVDREGAGGHPEKTLDDLVEALIALHDQTGEWLGPSEYESERERLDSSPSKSWFYDKNPAGLSSWSEVVEIAKRRH